MITKTSYSIIGYEQPSCAPTEEPFKTIFCKEYGGQSQTRTDQESSSLGSTPTGSLHGSYSSSIGTMLLLSSGDSYTATVTIETAKSIISRCSSKKKRR
jgi:hypothetical protein